MDATRMDTAWETVAAGAWHLLRSARTTRPAMVAMLTTSAALLHGTARATEAATGAFVNALARRSGPPAVTLAFGPWTALRPETAHPGVDVLSEAAGLTLFDQAITGGEASPVLADLDRRALRADPGLLPAMLRPPAGTDARAATADGPAALRRRLDGKPPAERANLLLDLVRAQVAAVLGHRDVAAVEPDQAFQELGFDSLAAVRLRQQLATGTGVGLPATLVFDHPTSRAVAGHLGTLLEPAEVSVVQPVLDDLDRLNGLIPAAVSADDDRALVVARLEAMLRELRPPAPFEDVDYDSATDDELFEVLDGELGRS